MSDDFEANVKKIGPNGDYTDFLTALSEAQDSTTLLLSPGTYSFNDTVLINKAVAIQVESGEPVIFKAPLFKVEADPSLFILFTSINFEGHVEVSGGSTVSFEACYFTCPEGTESIVSVDNSSPNFRLCHFHDFNGVGVSYSGDKGGIITDCVFEKITGEAIKKGTARPYNEHNVVK